MGVVRGRGHTFCDVSKLGHTLLEKLEVELLIRIVHGPRLPEKHPSRRREQPSQALLPLLDHLESAPPDVVLHLAQQLEHLARARLAEELLEPLGVHLRAPAGQKRGLHQRLFE